MKQKMLTALPFLFLTAAACSTTPASVTAALPTTTPVVAKPTAPMSADAASADRAFALRLYATQAGEKGNLFFSPASAHVALAMTYAGANGETASQMASTLGFTKDAVATSADFGAALKSWNASGEKVELHVVNRLWGQRSTAFLPEFVGLLGDRYAAPLERVDFVGAPDPSRLAINAWVDQNTAHQIKDLLVPGDITTETRLVLTNAVYFKGGWQHPFAAEDTRSDAFQVDASKTVSVELMNQSSGFAYAETGDAKVVSMPYGNGELSMVVVLPNAKDGLAALERTMSAAALDEWMAKMRPEEVAIALPKFRTTARMSLKPALSSMGMPIAFQEGRADFSGMAGTKDLYLADVIQKAFIRVDEKGTEAAAATAVIINTESARVPRVAKEFRADHPFVYFIRDKAGNVLFMGRTVDPTA